MTDFPSLRLLSGDAKNIRPLSDKPAYRSPSPDFPELQLKALPSFPGTGNAMFTAITKAGAPTTADVPNGMWALIRDTTNHTTKIYYNNAGTLQSIALV